MLVTEVKTVAGEVLGGTAKTLVGMSAVHVGFGHFHDSLHIVSVGAQSDDRVFPVVENVAYRGKGKVAADG